MPKGELMNIDYDTGEMVPHEQQGMGVYESKHATVRIYTCFIDTM